MSLTPPSPETATPSRHPAISVAMQYLSGKFYFSPCPKKIGVTQTVTQRAPRLVTAVTAITVIINMNVDMILTSL